MYIPTWYGGGHCDSVVIQHDQSLTPRSHAHARSTAVKRRTYPCTLEKKIYHATPTGNWQETETALFQQSTFTQTTERLALVPAVVVHTRDLPVL